MKATPVSVQIPADLDADLQLAMQITNKSQSELFVHCARRGLQQVARALQRQPGAPVNPTGRKPRQTSVSTPADLDVEMHAVMQERQVSQSELFVRCARRCLKRVVRALLRQQQRQAERFLKPGPPRT